MYSAQRPCTVPGSPGGLQSQLYPVEESGRLLLHQCSSPKPHSAACCPWERISHRNQPAGTCAGFCPASGLHTTYVPTRCRRSIPPDPRFNMRHEHCHKHHHVSARIACSRLSRHNGKTLNIMEMLGLPCVIPRFPATGTMQKPGAQARRRPRPQNLCQVLSAAGG